MKGLRVVITHMEVGRARRRAAPFVVVDRLVFSTPRRALEFASYRAPLSRYSEIQVRGRQVLVVNSVVRPWSGSILKEAWRGLPSPPETHLVAAAAGESIAAFQSTGQGPLSEMARKLHGSARSKTGPVSTYPAAPVRIVDLEIEWLSATDFRYRDRREGWVTQVHSGGDRFTIVKASTPADFFRTLRRSRTLFPAEKRRSRRSGPPLSGARGRLLGLHSTADASIPRVARSAPGYAELLRTRLTRLPARDVRIENAAKLMITRQLFAKAMADPEFRRYLRPVAGETLLVSYPQSMYVPSGTFVSGFMGARRSNTCVMPRGVLQVIHVDGDVVRVLSHGGTYLQKGAGCVDREYGTLSLRDFMFVKHAHFVGTHAPHLRPRRR